MGTASLHASIINGGRELSSYPDICRLQMERRTIPGETGQMAADEVAEILRALRHDDPEFDASVQLTVARPPYEIDEASDLPPALIRAASTVGVQSRTIGMSFWTDAAALGGAGIPSVLFGPGGAGLHSTEEYVNVSDVLACRDALAALALDYC
jgi:acetylornithine deacetylase